MVVVGVTDVAADSTVSNFAEITRNSRQAAGEERGEAESGMSQNLPHHSLLSASLFAVCFFFDVCVDAGKKKKEQLHVRVEQLRSRVGVLMFHWSCLLLPGFHELLLLL